MKIVYVVQYYPPHTGGLEQVAQKLAQEAVFRGHDVSVTTFALHKNDLGFHQEGGVAVHRVRGAHFMDAKFGIPFCFGGLGLWRTLRNEICSADVVHVHDVFYVTSWLAYFFSVWYRKPLVLTQHVAFVEHTSRFVMSVQKFVYAVFGSRIFKRSKKIFVYNSIVRDFLLERGVPEEKILEIRNGVDVELFRPVANDEEIVKKRTALGLPVDRPLVLFVGRMVPKKGFMEVFNARDPLYDLLFVGPGSVPEAWKEEEGIHVLGSKTQGELAEIYPLVDVFVSPTKGELFTLVMQESFAAGVPVVTTDEPAYIHYDIDRTGVAFCEPVGERIREEIKRILSDSTVRTHMKTYSRRFAEERFDWKKNYGAVIDMCERILEREKRVVVTTSWDDGHVLDVRVAELLSKYGVAGTFYVAPYNSERTKEECLSEDDVRKLSKSFEIGAHTMVHKRLSTLTQDEARREIITSKEYLEQVLQKPVTSFCYPMGDYKSEHVSIVKEAGYACARTVHRFALRVREEERFEMPTSVHTYDHWSDVWGTLVFVRFNVVRFFRLYRKWDVLAMAMFDQVCETGGVFHLWGHSFELEEHGDWERFEKVLKYVSGRDDVSYVTNSEVL